MLNRRTFCLTTAAATTAAVVPGLAVASETLDYTPGLIDQRLAAGETVFADWAADWCSTCRAQERILGALRSNNPAYDAAITFIRVDWDQYRGAEITQRLSLPRRSTLVLLRGDQELGRIVAGTREADIQALLDRGLA